VYSTAARGFTGPKRWGLAAVLSVFFLADTIQLILCGKKPLNGSMDGGGNVMGPEKGGPDQTGWAGAGGVGERFVANHPRSKSEWIPTTKVS